MSEWSPERIAAAKRALGLERLALQIHNASFPADADEDLGRGTPYLHGAERLCEFAARLGFDAIQLGPRGMTDRGNPSPYDSTIFSRNPLDLPLKRFVDEGRLSRKTWDAIRRALPAAQHGVVPYAAVYDAYQLALPEIIANASDADRASADSFLVDHEFWLVPDALFDVLTREHGTSDWNAWPEPDRRLFEHHERLAQLRNVHAGEINDYALIQSLLNQESQRLRVRTQQLGLTLYGDLQVGLSQRDLWTWQKLFLRDYRMGAPPSRTTASGQPWGYAVLDPALVGSQAQPGPALEFVRRRIQRLLDESAGVRIDHPHGWIDPWVYRIDDPIPFHAVQTGARLFSSPDDPRHPELAALAIPQPNQIEHSQPLHADGHVRDLSDAQVARYSVLVDELLAQANVTGDAAGKVACEVLSTLPYPVFRVLQRHGLGRFRVVQKLSLADAADVYRIENAALQDWIMLGTHDTNPIWKLADNWCGTPTGTAWANYLADRLGLRTKMSGTREELAAQPGRLVNACFAAMLASEAKHVAVFFPDLFGLRARYNEPGLVSTANWSLRLPSDFERFYERQLAHGDALDVRKCLEF